MDTKIHMSLTEAKEFIGWCEDRWNAEEAYEAGDFDYCDLEAVAYYQGGKLPQVLADQLVGLYIRAQDIIQAWEDVGN